MSLFSRTVAEVDALETKLATFDAAASESLLVRKDAAEAVNAAFVELQPTVLKIVAKAEAGERDPNRRTYGASMVAKIFTMRDRFEKITSDFTPRYATLCEEWTAYEQKQRLENERKREEEETARRAEGTRLEAEREKQRLEDEKCRRLEKEREDKLRLQREEAEKKAADQRESDRKKQEAEKIAAEKIHREEEAAAVLTRNKKDEAAAAVAKDSEMAEAAKTISLSIRTTRGVTHTLKDVSADATVADVKLAIERAHGIIKPAQRLIFQGRLLVDANTIFSYKISDGSAIHLVENPRVVAAAASASSAAAAPVEKQLVPAGTICHLQNGKTQYDAILAQCGSHRLVVTDWFAPWCGPCRAISPVYERLAARFSDVTFVKVDTEASAANAALATENNIEGYPTFHFVLNATVHHSFSGANASAIEANIKRYRAIAVPRASASDSANGVGTSSRSIGTQGSISTRVMTALTTLKRNLGMPDFVVAVRTLLTFLRNIVNNPGMEKYRRVRTANSTFQTRLGSKQGGVDCMHAFGFEEVVDDGDNFLVMPAAAAEVPELQTVMAQLESALTQASGGSGGGLPSGSRGGGVGTTGATPQMGDDMQRALQGLAGIMGGGEAGGGGMEQVNGMMMHLLRDPSFQQIAADIAADPEAVGTMAQAQEAIGNGDTQALERMRAHPAMARLQSALMANPAFLNTMMRHAAGQGFPGMDGMGGGGGGGGAQGGTQGGGVQGANDDDMAAPHYPGAPSTAEEEERLLQEAIRLSMQDQTGRERRDEGPKDGGEDTDGKQT